MTYRPAGILVLFMSFFALFYSSTALAISEEEMSYLRMYFKDEELEVVSSTRSLKSISRVAENMTVVTASDIELMNAHTLADVLRTVNGVFLNTGITSPGGLANPQIQLSELRHVAVFMDGIPMNNLSNFTTDLGKIPAQHIRKIEIIQGPASSAWGSSIGGVINVITKSPSEKTGGMLSTSFGERDTGDFRAEAFGKKDRVGFYISAGRLITDGLRPVNDAANNNIYTKLSYDLSSDANLNLTMFYTNGSRGNWQDKILYMDYGRDKFKTLLSSISLNTALSSESRLDISLYSSMIDEKSFWYFLSDNSEEARFHNKENAYGAKAKITWDRGIHSVVIGSDYDNGTLRSEEIKDGKQGMTRWAAYANNTISLGKFAVTPGIRYDNTDTNGDAVSPSLGVTYELLKKTILRVNVARGFSIPAMAQNLLKESAGYKGNPDLKVEHVTSYQAGIETSALHYLWLKLSVFRHDIKHGILPETTDGITTHVNKDEIRRQGIEAEMKTLPVYNTHLFASVIAADIDNLRTGEEIRDMPTYSYILGAQYDDQKSFRALLQGNYIWWNSTGGHLAKYSSMVFDVNLIKTVIKHNAKSLEAFLTAHNIFNNNQYWDYYYINPPRWVEAGVRFKF